MHKQHVDAATPRTGAAIWFLSLVPALAFLGFFAVLPLSWENQAILGVFLAIAVFILNRLSTGRTMTLAMVLVSCFCTARYGFYRYSETIWNLETSWSQVHFLDLFFVIALLAAETYSFLILFLGHFQTVRPLGRRPLPLPESSDRWPSVDVFIPTYNEPLDVVKPTVLAALNIDWPEDRFHIYILDDGRRSEFEEFARECGAAYITRLDNEHAKAGNINHAMRLTDAEYIAIFDCDHIPTRSFLQMTMGWFLADDRLAMLQTPHHYYSPDPFERNLDVFRVVPNEGALFYGIIQDANDFWNATFFCGSCAVLRRTALEQIGGVAVETVTEDAHTALRLQSEGWNTAYLNIPQAAGLATNKLSDHVGQRIRWARGMVQILRIDNPLLIRGLSLPQRLCYFNAMLHFLFAAPRLIFLTSPLVYLLLGRYNVFGYLPTILAYAFPHLIVSTVTNSRIQGKYRHSFWNELYEIALAPYILLPTWLALINPRWGKFNVTAKKNLVEGAYFDWPIAKPFVALLLLNAVGLAIGLHQYFLYGDANGVLTVNLFWAFFNVVSLSGVLAVAQEKQQLRNSVRVDAKLPMRLILPNGEHVEGRTLNLSRGGLLARVMRSGLLQSDDTATVEISLADYEFKARARVVDCWGAELRFEFQNLTLSQQAALTRTIFSRADTWLNWHKKYEGDRPLRSIVTLLAISGRGLSAALKAPFARRKKSPEQALKGRREIAVPIILLLAALCCVPLKAAPAVPETGESVQKTPVPAPSFSDRGTLDSLGYKQGLVLRGNGSHAEIYFGVPLTKLVTSASLELRFRLSPGLVAGSAQLNLTLNGSRIASIPVNGSPDSANTISQSNAAIPAELFLPENTLSFELVGSCAPGCDEMDESGVWLAIEPTTELLTNGTRIPLPNDLSLLPAPFLDVSANRTITLPFAMDERPSSAVLTAAGIVASRIGMRAGHQGICFSASLGRIPPGDVVLVATRNSPLVSGLGITTSGWNVLMRDNPNDPYGKLLVIVADKDDHLVDVARAFALEDYTRSGPQAAIGQQQLPEPRAPYDAPRWLQTDREVRLLNGTESELQSMGNNTINLYFRLPPDLYYGSRDVVPLRLQYRCSKLLAAAKAEVKINLNGNFVAARPIPIGSPVDVKQEIIPLPAAALYPRNTLSVEFSFERVKLPAGRSPQTEILRGTELLIRGLPHFSEMPRLDLFATTGFPFTRFADLSTTAVMLPRDPRPDEISLFLTLLGFMSAQTGYPGIRVTVQRGLPPGGAPSADLLVLGTFQDQPLFRHWADFMSVVSDGERLELAGSPGWSAVLERVPWLPFARPRRALELFLQGAPIDGVVQAFQSPVAPEYSVVAISAPTDMEEVTQRWSAFANASEIRGAVSLLSTGSFRFFRVARNRYHLGSLQLGQAVQYWARRYYWLAPLVIFPCIWLIATFIGSKIEARAAARLELRK